MRRNLQTIGIFVLAAVFFAGCASRRPAWMGGRREPGVIPPLSTAPLPQPDSAPAEKSSPLPVSNRPAVGDAPEASQTLSQAEPTLLGENGSPKKTSRRDEPLSLTDLETLGGDLPWASAQEETLTEQLSEEESAEEDEGPKVEYVPRLALLPEEQEVAEREAKQKQPSGVPRRSSPSRRGRRSKTPAAPAGSPDDLRARMTVPEGAEEEKTFEEEEEEAEEEPSAKVSVVKRRRTVPPEAEEETASPAPSRKPFVEGQEEVVAGMTLQINDQHVTVEEILAGLHKELSAIPKHVSRERFRRMAAEIITERMWSEARSILMFAEANRRLEDQVKEKIKEELADVRRELIAKADGSVETLKARLRREGTTLEDVMKRHERELTIRYYMQVKFAPAIVVNRRMLWNYYRRHKTDFVVEREVQMQIIAAPFRKFLPDDVRNPTEEELQAAREEALRTIRQAEADLRAGKDFGETAKRYSRDPRAKQGGIWPMMTAGNFRNTRVENEAFTLPEGQYSGIIEGQDGYYIVKALKVKPGRVTPFEIAQDKIETILRNEQYDKLSREYMDKLYKDAVISSPPDFIPTAVELALERYKGPE